MKTGSLNNVVTPILIIGIVVAINVLGLYFFENQNKAKLQKLIQTGIAGNAEIIELRRYFPSQGQNRYGQVFYQFFSNSGKQFKSNAWVSESQFDLLKGKDTVAVLYDKADPKINKINLL